MSSNPMYKFEGKKEKNTSTPKQIVRERVIEKQSNKLSKKIK